MNNETLFPHKTFLHQNAIDVDKLPEALRKRIYGFEELEQDLPTTVDADRDRLLSRMEDLSHELIEDLEEHFEDHIANKDEHDDDEPQDETPQEPAPVQEHECACKHAKIPEEEPTAEAAPEEVPAPVEMQAKIVTDEDILAELLESGWNKILPADLRKKGFKGTLNFKVIVVGRFYLRRGKYDTHYQILKGWD